MSTFEPNYLDLHRNGILKKRGQQLWELMRDCNLCPRECGANRLKGEEGRCGANVDIEISAAHPHYGEERPLSGTSGSGTIFFTHCGLKCVFCINCEISHEGEGYKMDATGLAGMMLKLQDGGCHNINLVSPSHYSAQILLALDIAAAQGLRLPLVYNTCGWERKEILDLIDGIVDIYLADIKYDDPTIADVYSPGAFSYPAITKKAIVEMHRQVGVARPAASGLMQKGLMIRHLVMPNNVSGSKNILSWIANTLPKDTYINIMSQYRPNYKATEFPQINRKITNDEYHTIVQHAQSLGLTNLDIQGYYY